MKNEDNLLREEDRKSIPDDKDEEYSEVGMSMVIQCRGKNVVDSSMHRKLYYNRWPQNKNILNEDK